MRKGMAIFEMLIAVFVLGFLMLIVAGPTGKITVEIPRMTRDFEIDSSLSDVVEKIRIDVESASAVMTYPGSESFLGEMLVIQTPQGAVSYYIADGEIVKQVQREKTAFIWKVVPGGRLRWEVWYNGENEQNAVAVQLTHGVARKIAGKVRERLVNSHVFFVGANNTTGGKI